MKCFKTCIIVYGFLSNEQLFSFEKDQIILIEPRKSIIDIIKKDLPANVKLIPKLLSPHNNLQEKSLYKVIEPTGLSSFHTDYPAQRHTSSMLTKEKCYSTSIQNIIRQFKIQIIQALIINIDIDNIDECISNAKCFNHIISYLSVFRDCKSFSPSKSFVHTLFKFIELNTQHPFRCLIGDSFSVFEHKNLHIPVPKICMYITDVIPPSQQDNFDLLIAQYNITLLSTPNKPIEKICINEEDNNNITNALVENKAIQDFDIIIQFNPKYLAYKDFFQILYPIKDNVLYSIKEFDIIYGTKNCMYMLCQITESKYFTDYLDDLKKNKKVIYKLFFKKYFYDYLSKIFDIKQIQ